MQGLWLFVVGIATVSAWDYQLVWEDNFDFLDMSKWQHEVTAWGGGVSHSLGSRV